MSAWQAVKAERVFKTLVTLFLRLKTPQSKKEKNIQGSFSVQKKSFDSNGFLSEEQDSQTPNAIFQQWFSNVCNKNNRSFYTMIHVVVYVLKMTWYMPAFIACLLVNSNHLFAWKFHWAKILVTLTNTFPTLVFNKKTVFPYLGKMLFFIIIFSPASKDTTQASITCPCFLVVLLKAHFLAHCP